MRNLFVTYAYGEEYSHLTNIMVNSICELSNSPIQVYKHMIPKPTSSPEERFVEFCRLKILCCIDAIEHDMGDNYVWIDGDSVAHKNIDKIWFESKRVENYPLLGKYRYKNFDYYQDDEFPSKKLAEKLGIGFNNYIYRQANLMLFNKNCLPFFKEVLEIMDSEKDYSIMPAGDESVMNVLFCKYGYTNNLGHINLCSESFYPDNGIINFIKMKNREDYYNTFTIYENNYEDILVFHGNKNIDESKNILNTILEVWK